MEWCNTYIFCWLSSILKEWHQNLPHPQHKAISWWVPTLLRNGRIQAKNLVFLVITFFRQLSQLRFLPGEKSWLPGVPVASKEAESNTWQSKRVGQLCSQWVTTKFPLHDAVHFMQTQINDLYNFPSLWRTSFNMSYKEFLLLTNLCNFCLCEKGFVYLLSMCFPPITAFSSATGLLISGS